MIAKTGGSGLLSKGLGLPESSIAATRDFVSELIKNTWRFESPKVETSRPGDVIVTS
jgi:hypothetical protein